MDKLDRRQLLTGAIGSLFVSRAIAGESFDVVMKSILNNKSPARYWNQSKNPIGSSPKAIEFIKSNSLSYEGYSEHDLPLEKLKLKICEVDHVDTSQVFIGNGARALIREVILKSKLLGYQSLKMFRMDYGALRKYADEFSLPYEFINYSEQSFDISLLQLKKNLKKRQVLYFSNPNLPTGVFVSPDQLSELIKSLPETLFIIDECYLQYWDSEFGKFSLVSLATQVSNLIVVRTFSKIYGLMALRVGYVIGMKPTLKKFMPTNDRSRLVSSLSALACTEALMDLGHLQRSREVIAEMRKKAAQSFESWQLRESKTNFVFFERDLLSAEKNKGTDFKKYENELYNKYNFEFYLHENKSRIAFQYCLPAPADFDSKTKYILEILKKERLV